MSSGPEVVVAGGGIAAAATAIRLRGLGLGVRLLVRAGAPMAGIEALPERALGLLDILGEPQLVTDAGGLAVGGNGQAPMVHVERGALARAFLDRAQDRGAVVTEVHRLPLASALASSAHAVIDATGRAAAWSRPVVTDGHDVARQFEGPPDADVALRMVQGDRWWAYRLGTASTTWAGVITAGDGAADRPAAEQALRRLGLDPDEMTPRGRRSARVQRALHPVDTNRVSVGDAALAHDPVAGAGIRFALASAIAAATVVASWADDPGRHDLAACYYTDLVTGEHSRHLEARGAIHAGGSRVELLEEVPEAGPPPDVVQFAAAIMETPLAVDGLITPGQAVKLPDGTLTRWLGSFDLLDLARLSSDPIPRVVLLARLQAEGLDVVDARAVVAWALRHRLLSG